MTPSRPLVFVIDDDEDIREVVSLVLEWRGLEVATAGSGAEAVARLRDGLRPSVIVLDLMMPGMSGVQVLETLRAEQVCDGVPVLVVSGDFRARELAESLGVDELLPKPIELDELVAAVLRLIRDGAGAPAGR